MNQNKSWRKILIIPALIAKIMSMFLLYHNIRSQSKKPIPLRSSDYKHKRGNAKNVMVQYFVLILNKEFKVCPVLQTEAPITRDEEKIPTSLHHSLNYKTLTKFVQQSK